MLAGAVLGATPSVITTSTTQPIGVAATESQLLFTQPFCSDITGQFAPGTGGTQIPVVRGVYSVDPATAAVSLYAALPAPTTSGTQITLGGFTYYCAEMYIALTQNGFAVHSFTPGTAYVTQGAEIFAIPPGGGSAAPLSITGAALSATQGHSGIQFDTSTNCAFGCNLIYTSENGIWEITAAGAATQLTSNVPVVGSDVLIESPSVTPGGTLYVTAEDDNGTGGAGPLSGLYQLAGTSLTPALTTPNQSPESINFVPANACSLTVNGTAYGAFLTVYDTTNPIGKDAGAVSQIDGFLAGDIAPLSPNGILTFEYSPNATFIGSLVDVGPDLEVFNPATLATPPFATVDEQLEGFNLVTCNVPPPPPPPGGCPATQGFWHKAANWPVVRTAVTVSGITGLVYNTNQSITIGSFSYSQADLLQLLPSGSLHSGNYANSLSQFVAAILNVVAGAKQTAAGNAAILSDFNALKTFNIFAASTSLANAPASIVNTVEANQPALNDYNSAVGLNCQEGSGLNTGSGKGKGN
jgi:hypothetical protein